MTATDSVVEGWLSEEIARLQDVDQRRNTEAAPCEMRGLVVGELQGRVRVACEGTVGEPLKMVGIGLDGSPRTETRPGVPSRSTLGSQKPMASKQETDIRRSAVVGRKTHYQGFENRTGPAGPTSRTADRAPTRSSPDTRTAYYRGPPENRLIDMKDSKEAIYGTLDAWVAWEQNFPLALLKRALLVLEKEEQWHRIVQVIKWMLSKGQGITMGTYEQLIRALEKDCRPEEAHNIWVKKISYDLHSVPWRFCDLMLSIYYRNNMLERLVKLFKDIESFGRKPPSKSIVRKVVDAYELLGLLEEKNVLLQKYDDLFNSSSRESSKKSRKFSKRGIAAGQERLRFRRRCPGLLLPANLRLPSSIAVDVSVDAFSPSLASLLEFFLLPQSGSCAINFLCFLYLVFFSGYSSSPCSVCRFFSGLLRLCCFLSVSLLLSCCCILLRLPLLLRPAAAAVASSPSAAAAPLPGP
ncbi:Pentatricopeptide repeat-containing protein [Platanthera guangdongensis]|uniref:Pentatricopeptide repeat-containing protein n=1 Tax=Platanthera guangdongensis TaxID=2320717 RepID=A0ABR2MX83_9ASPA